jgi:phage repressor protein C with HTH and peptisase S24 domain
MQSGIMSDVADRLTKARIAAGYARAAEAARALGIPSPTYLAYENGGRGFSRHYERFARFYRVSLVWLVSGRGEMRARTSSPTLPLLGTVGAGPGTSAIDDVNWSGPVDTRDLPTPDDAFLLQVTGDSGYPRYQHGEFIVVDRKPIRVEHAIGMYCVLDLADGRRVVKRLNRDNGKYILQSHNAPDEESPLIIACHPVIGCLSR